MSIEEENTLITTSKIFFLGLKKKKGAALSRIDLF